MRYLPLLLVLAACVPKSVRDARTFMATNQPIQAWQQWDASRRALAKHPEWLPEVHEVQAAAQKESIRLFEASLAKGDIPEALQHLTYAERILSSSLALENARDHLEAWVIDEVRAIATDQGFEAAWARVAEVEKWGAPQQAFAARDALADDMMLAVDRAADQRAYFEARAIAEQILTYHPRYQRHLAKRIRLLDVEERDWLLMLGREAAANDRLAEAYLRVMRARHLSDPKDELQIAMVQLRQAFLRRHSRTVKVSFRGDSERRDRIQDNLETAFAGIPTLRVVGSGNADLYVDLKAPPESCERTNDSRETMVEYQAGVQTTSNPQFERIFGEWQHLRSERHNLLEQLDEARGERKDVEQSIGQLEVKFHQARRDYHTKEQALNDAEAKLANVRLEVAALKQQMVDLVEGSAEHRSLSIRLRKAESRVASANSSWRAARDARDKEGQDLAQERKRFRRKEKKLAYLQAQIKEMEDELLQKEVRIREFRKKLKTISPEIEQAVIAQLPHTITTSTYTCEYSGGATLRIPAADFTRSWEDSRTESTSDDHWKALPQAGIPANDLSFPLSRELMTRQADHVFVQGILDQLGTLVSAHRERIMQETLNGSGEERATAYLLLMFLDGAQPAGMNDWMVTTWGFGMN